MGLGKVLAKLGIGSAKVAGKVALSGAKAFASGFIEGVLNPHDPSRSNKRSNGGRILNSHPKSSVDPFSSFRATQQKKARNIVAPTFMTFEQQVKDILKSIDSLRKIQQKQLDLSRLQYTLSIRKDEEAMMEQGKDAVPVESDNIDIGELKDSMDKFSHALDEAIHKLSNLGKGASWNPFGKNRGFNPFAGSKGKTSPKLPKGIKEEHLLDKNGNKLAGAARQSRINKLLKEQKLAKESKLLGRFKFGAKKILRTEEIAKIATPLIEKAGIKTLGKSIPFIGAGLGLAFAIDRLVDGDVVGAGLEAVSGIGGPATAIPATAAAISRDVYYDSYGVQPEEDPQGSERMSSILKTVKKLISEKIFETKKNKPKPTHVPINPIKPLPANDNVKPLSKPTAVPSPPAAQSSSKGGSPKTGGGSKPVKPGSSKSVSPSPQTSNTAKPANSVQNKSAAAGSNISTASVNIEKSINTPRIPENDIPRMFPNKTAVFSGTGVGDTNNVPDPNYYFDDELSNQLYFSAAN